MSDGWASYAAIDQIAGGIYRHETIIHEQHFVDPEDETIHTQNIENTWMRVNKKIKRQFGTNKALFETYMAEFLWRNRVREHLFGNFLVAIHEVYPV